MTMMNQSLPRRGQRQRTMTTQMTSSAASSRRPPANQWTIFCEIWSGSQARHPSLNPFQSLRTHLSRVPVPKRNTKPCRVEVSGGAAQPGAPTDLRQWRVKNQIGGCQVLQQMTMMISAAGQHRSEG